MCDDYPNSDDMKRVGWIYEEEVLEGYFEESSCFHKGLATFFEGHIFPVGEMFFHSHIASTTRLLDGQKVLACWRIKKEEVETEAVEKKEMVPSLPSSLRENWLVFQENEWKNPDIAETENFIPVKWLWKDGFYKVQVEIMHKFHFYVVLKPISLAFVYVCSLSKLRIVFDSAGKFFIAEILLN